jgi:hypothetical protein
MSRRPAVELLITSNGSLRGLYSELIDLTCLGQLSIRRGSHVEPDQQGRWFADLAPVSGPRLGPFALRSQALEAEQAWLEANWL